jgi:hypothetical protein
MLNVVVLSVVAPLIYDPQTLSNSPHHILTQKNVSLKKKMIRI